MLQTINLIYFLLYNRLSLYTGRLTVWLERMALAHFAEAKTDRSYTLAALDSTIFIAVLANNTTHEIEVASVFTRDAEPEAARAALGQKGKVIWWEDIASFRIRSFRAINGERD